MNERVTSIMEIAKIMKEGGQTPTDNTIYNEISVDARWELGLARIKAAEALYNAGYRKIPECATILPFEDVQMFREDEAKVKFLKAQIQREAKQKAAKEILQEVFAFFPSDTEKTTISRSEIREIAKKYGVEVEG